MYKLIIAASIILPSFAGARQSSPKIVDSVKNYLDKSIGIIQDNALNSKNVDWTTLRQQIYQETTGAKTYEDILPIYPFIFEQIDDHHGSLKYRGRSYGWNKNLGQKVSGAISAATKKYNTVRSQSIGKDIGYILVPGNNDFRASKMDSITLAIKQAIARVSSKKIKGWIIDLRLNTGGNMYPMIAGLSELIGQGNLGGFINSTNQSQGDWIIKNNTFYVDSTKVSSVLYTGYPSQADVPIAVLISGNTASSGEMTAIATIGRKNSIRIGEHSAGYTTINQGFKLNAYSGLNLAVNYVADRTGKVYPKNINPDIYIAGGDDFEVLRSDLKVKRAVRWLRSRK